MFISIQTICTCHGYLLFESVHCERCRSLIPFQLSDESLLDPVSTNNIGNGITFDKQGKPPPGILVPYRKQQQQTTTTGRIRLRALCPFCNSSTFILRYYCKRERLYYHLRIQNCGENEYVPHRSIADTQNMISIDQFGVKRDQTDSSANETTDDSYSMSGSIPPSAPSSVIFDQQGFPNARDTQIDNERKMYGFNEIEGDLFAVLRNGLFYDTLIQCQDDVKLQVHRCILGGRSTWFRHLISEYHESNTNDDYVLQVSIDDIQSEVMNEILNFIYTNRCLITLKNAPNLLIAAKRFELDKLTKQIGDFLLYRLTVDNAIEMLICAHESGSEALKLACIRLINRNAEKIKRTEKWKSFKTQYIDLVPELYENRVEHPAPAPQAYIPDVFTQPDYPSETIRSLSQLYENPIHQRIETPKGRLLPAARTQTFAQPVVTKAVHLVEPHASGPNAPGGPYPEQPSDSDQSAPRDRASPIKKPVLVNPRRPIPPIIRTVLPNIRQNSDVDIGRRPVNLSEPRSYTQPASDLRKKYTRIPTPPPARNGSPRRYIRNAPMQPDDHLTLTRVVSIEPSD